MASLQAFIGERSHSSLADARASEIEFLGGHDECEYPLAEDITLEKWLGGHHRLRTKLLVVQNRETRRWGELVVGWLGLLLRVIILFPINLEMCSSSFFRHIEVEVWFPPSSRIDELRVE